MRDASPLIVMILIATAFVAGHTIEFPISWNEPAETESVAAATSTKDSPELTVSKREETARRSNGFEVQPVIGYFELPGVGKASDKTKSTVSAPAKPVEVDQVASNSAVPSQPELVIAASGAKVSPKPTASESEETAQHATPAETQEIVTAPEPTSATPVKQMVTKRFVVYFAFDSARISAKAQRTVREAMAFAKTIGTSHVSLMGHTDRAGAAHYNMKLSRDRANAVFSAFRSLGKPGKDFDVEAFGEHKLAVSTPDGKAEPRNRRVEIVVTA